MPDGLPVLISIEHDDYHAKYIGHTADGRQFFLTTPFEPAISGRPGCEFIALYLFNAAGVFIEAKIDQLGPRITVEEQRVVALRNRWLRELGVVSFERIEVAPFSLERFGIKFGLIPRPPENESDAWWVEMQPGNFMAFHEPWDSGEYDT